MNNSSRKSAFTLIELVVVLAILAALAAIATRQLGGVVETRKIEAARRGLDEVRAAVVGENPSRRVEGFYADMGRFPAAVTNGGGRVWLGELLQCPAGAAFKVLQATTANGVDLSDADPGVWVGVGWRGPYLGAASGDVPRDPWGNAYETPDDAGFARLSVDSNNRITGVRHFGPTAVDQTLGDEARTVWNDLPETKLSVVVQAIDSNGALVEPERLGTVTVRVYQPDPHHSGKIECVRSNPAAADSVKTAFSIDSGLVPGKRVVRVESSLLGKGPVREVELVPGENQLWQNFLASSVNIEDPAD